MFNRELRANFLKFEKKKIESLLAHFSEKSVKTRYEEKMKRLKNLQDRGASISDAELLELKSLEDLAQGNRMVSELEAFVGDLKKISDPNYFKEMSLKDIRKFASEMLSVDVFYRTLVSDSSKFESKYEHSELYDFERSLNILVIARRCVPLSWHEERAGTPESPNPECADNL